MDAGLEMVGDGEQRASGEVKALKNATPDDLWFGRGEATLDRRRTLRLTTLLVRRCYNRGLTQQRASGVETPETVASSTSGSVPF